MNGVKYSGVVPMSISVKYQFQNICQKILLIEFEDCFQLFMFV